MGVVAGNNRFLQTRRPARASVPPAPRDTPPDAPSRAAMPIAVERHHKKGAATRGSRSAVCHRSVVIVITPLAVALLTVKLTVMLEMPFA